MFGGLSFSHHGSPLLPRPARTITSLRLATPADDGTTLCPHLCEASHHLTNIIFTYLWGV